MSRSLASLPLSLRFALRELRGGLKGFYVFIACIALGVAAIAAVGSLSRALHEGISEQGQAILGGDLAVSLIHRQVDDEEHRLLAGLGRVSEVATLRAMARAPNGESQTLAEVKAVDGAYPLYGVLSVAGSADPAEALGRRANGYGLLAEPSLAARLGLDLGDQVAIGHGTFVLTGFISNEPDRLSGGGIGWGPRAIMSVEALHASGLVQPGSLIRWRYRVALPPPASDESLAAAMQQVEAQAEASGWQVRPRTDASPGLSDQISRFTMFLTLVGLTALVIGGVGVANAVNAYLDSRRETIATLKSVGAPGALIFRTYLFAMLLLAAGAMFLGLAAGALAPWLVGSALSAIVPVADAVPGLYWRELLQALAYGTLTALAFALWPLARAREVPASGLFRDHVSAYAAWPRRRYIAALVAIVLALAGLAIVLAYDRLLALYFVGGALGAFIVLRLVAIGIMALARRAPRRGAVALRLALAAIHRPGAVTASVVLSLGLGLTLLVSVALIDGNLTRQLTMALPERAPSFFFLDIPREDGARFAQLVSEEAPQGAIEEVPMLRGRIVSLGGRPVSEIEPPPEAAWVLRGDRGITYAETLPAGSRLEAGAWWPAEYEGPPLVSFDAELAEDLRIGIGDTVEVNVLGRSITAEIANLRSVDWQSLSINFVMVFSPNTFAGAPHMLLSTLTMPDEAGDEGELALMRAVTAEFPTVTSVRVKEALDSVNEIVRRLAWAIRAASGFTLVAGIFVLAGALAASHRHRIHDAVVLKTLGAERSRLINAYAIEFAIVGGATAAFALAAGIAASWFVVTSIMRLDFTFLPVVALVATAGALILTIGLGLAGTWRVLGRKPAAYLRDL